MEHYLIFILLTLQLVKSSIKVQRMQRVPSCPMDFKGWETASNNLDCSTINRKFTYHCSPVLFRTYSVEYCFFNYLLKDGCLTLKEDELLPTIVSCETFAWGCPSNVFNSSELYKHPACLQIHPVYGCYLATSTCNTTVPGEPRCRETEQPLVDGQWSKFISHGFTKCSVTCGGGFQNFIETRECNNPIPRNGGSTCSGPGVRVTPWACNVQKCRAMPKYSEWSDCSATCGTGTQMRVRLQRKMKSNATYLQTKPCNKGNCPYLKKKFPFLSVEFLSTICAATSLSFLLGVCARSVACKCSVREQRDFAETSHDQIQPAANERYSDCHLRSDNVESYEDVPGYSFCDDEVTSHSSQNQMEKTKSENASLYLEPCSASHRESQSGQERYSKGENRHSYYCNNEYENINSVNT